VGTGDGAFARRTARQQPTHLVIGVDANADGLREASRRSKAKPPNLLLGRLALEDAPGELAGLADRITVLLPWGSLLCAVALPDPDALTRLHALAHRDARLRVVLGYAEGADDAAITTLGLPHLDARALIGHYRRAGFAMTAAPSPARSSAAWAQPGRRSSPSRTTTGTTSN
jgi:16S rRNA (adenine(1408)-N(1))-methyltransferase